MQFEKEIGVEYFDRVVLVIREKDNGEMVQRGADNGRNIIRIRRSDSGRCWLSGHCAMQEILRAYILQWPSGISEDGCTITLWLIDTSLDRRQYKRKFELTFFDETSCKKFFESFTTRIPDSNAIGPSYLEMREGTKGGQEDDSDGSETTFGEEDKCEDEDKQGHQRNDKKAGDVDAGDDSSASEADVDELKRILEIEATWGDSQDLFHPHRPYCNDEEEYY